MKVLHFIWGLVKNNLLLKVMAVLFAVVLWSYVLAETNPVRETVINDVPVRYENADQLSAKDLAISKSLSEVLEKVSVRVDVKQSYMKNVTKDTVQAKVDLSQINGTGEWDLDISYSSTNANCTVIGVSPSKVKLVVDENVDRTLQVEVQTTGSAADGYYASQPVASPDTVTISGAQVDVEKASRAVCNVDITGMTSWVKKTLDVTILDDGGNKIDTGLYGSLPSVIVDMSILPKKTVAVDVAHSIIGQDSLAPGYEITGITCDPDIVEIVGTSDALAGITSVQLVPYSVSGASSDVVLLLDYLLPEGVSVLDSKQAQVTVTIREKTRSEEFTGVSINARNLGGGLTAQLAQTKVDVTVLAGVSKMSALRASDIIPYVDLNGLGVGTHTVAVLFVLPQGFAEENFTPSFATVTVTITKG